jgi:hypothetical protein
MLEEDNSDDEYSGEELDDEDLNSDINMIQP